MRPFVFLLCIALLPVLPDPAESQQSQQSQQAAELESALHKAEEHYFSGRFNTALLLFNRIKEKDPENYLATTYSADILLMRKNYAGAIENYSIAAELSPNPHQEFFRLGQIYYLQRNATRAEEYFNRALEQKKDLAECHFYLALIHFYFYNRKDMARKHFGEYIKARPDAPQKESIQKILQNMGF